MQCRCSAGSHQFKSGRSWRPPACSDSGRATPSLRQSTRNPILTTLLFFGLTSLTNVHKMLTQFIAPFKLLTSITYNYPNIVFAFADSSIKHLYKKASCFLVKTEGYRTLFLTVLRELDYRVGDAIHAPPRLFF